MKLVSGLPVALAAEHRAIVGELKHNSLEILQRLLESVYAYLLEITSVK